MIAFAYVPTPEQETVINQNGNAFITACPGAGKTRTLVERARKLLIEPGDRRGIAFLSFTNAAIEELEGRLRSFGVLPNPLFPSYIGTFDRFLWQFFIAPFGIPNCENNPKLVPDKGDWIIQPYDAAHPFELNCFDRVSGTLDPKELAKIRKFRRGFTAGAHETSARATIARSIRNGQIDFEDVRNIVKSRLEDASFSKLLGDALASRFREIVVDEAQDCNRGDLDIITWLRTCGAAVKVICDPNQSIYGFRGGITEELQAYAQTFDERERLKMTGNFRSSPGICSAIFCLRAPDLRIHRDTAEGQYREDQTAVHIISYPGNGVSSQIGIIFGRLVTELGIPLHHAPIVASTRASAGSAVGQSNVGNSKHMTILLADAAMKYHFSFASGDRREALVHLHRRILLVRDCIKSMGEYHKYLGEAGLEDGRWRPEIISIADELRFDLLETHESWLDRARRLLSVGLPQGMNIKSRLKNDGNLASVLAPPPANSPPCRTIHSVKGLEFPAVCVVMTATSARGILDLLRDGTPGAAEESRKIYVGASRAKRLLAIAVPQSQLARLSGLLTANHCPIVHHQI